MQPASIRIGLITQDGELRAQLASALGPISGPFELAVDIGVPFTQIGDGWLGHLRASQPHVLVLDLEEDPSLGLRLGQFLADADPALRIVGVGPVLGPERLVAAMRAGFMDYLPRPVTG